MISTFNPGLAGTNRTPPGWHPPLCVFSSAASGSAYVSLQTRPSWTVSAELTELDAVSARLELRHACLAC
jgi:hypothetical protein